MSSEDYELFRPPYSEGDFRLLLVHDRGKRISRLLYISVPALDIDFEAQLADIRVLMGRFPRTGVGCTFVIATGSDLSHVKEGLDAAFVEMKTFVEPQIRDQFHLEIWDEDTLQRKEQELGIRVDIPGLS